MSDRRVWIRYLDCSVQYVIVDDFNAALARAEAAEASLGEARELLSRDE